MVRSLTAFLFFGGVKIIFCKFYFLFAITCYKGWKQAVLPNIIYIVFHCTAGLHGGDSCRKAQRRRTRFGARCLLIGFLDAVVPLVFPLFIDSLYHSVKSYVKRCGVLSLGFISLSREKRVPTVCYCALRHHFGFEKTSKKLSFSTLVSSLGKRKESERELRSDSFWSEWRDLNSRPLDPQSSALPTAPHPDNVLYYNGCFGKKQAFFSLSFTFSFFPPKACYTASPAPITL